MSDAVTTNYSFTKPTVGGDSGTWGDVLNDDLDSIDSTIKTVSDVANAALPLAGGTLTGTVAAKALNYPVVALGSVSGDITLDLSLGNFFTFTVTGDITSISLSNAPGSGRLVPIILQITNGGAHTIAYGTAFKFPAASAPALTVSGIDFLGFQTHDAGTTISLMGVQLDDR